MCETSDDQFPNDFREPYEELWWTAAPAVLDALDDDVGGRLPRSIRMRLQDWIERATSEDPVAALDQAALDRAYRDLSILHLSCYAYSVTSCQGARPPLAGRRLKSDRGHAVAVLRAQDCVARIACALHGGEGARVILAALKDERTLERRIFEKVETYR